MGFCNRCDGDGGHDEGCQFYNPDPTFIIVDFDHLTKQDFLGESVSLPWSLELQNALVVVEATLLREMSKRKANQREQFLAIKYAELKEYEGDTSRIKEILNEIVDYEDAL